MSLRTRIGLGLVTGISLMSAPALAAPCDGIASLEDLTKLVEETKTNLLDGTDEAPAVATRLIDAMGCLDEVPTATAAKAFFFIAAEAVSRVDPDNIADQYLQAYAALTDEELWSSVYGSDLKDRIDALDPEAREHGVIMATPSRFPTAPQIYGQGPFPPWILTPGPVTVESGVWSVQVTLEPNGLVIMQPEAFGPKEQKQLDLQITTPEPVMERRWILAGGLAISRSPAGDTASTPTPGAWLGLGPGISAAYLAPLSPTTHLAPTAELETTIGRGPSAWLRSSSLATGLDVYLSLDFGQIAFGPRFRVANTQELSDDESQLLRGNHRAFGASVSAVLSETDYPAAPNPSLAVYSDGARTYVTVALEGALTGVFE